MQCACFSVSPCESKISNPNRIILALCSDPADQDPALALAADRRHAPDGRGHDGVRVHAAPRHAEGGRHRGGGRGRHQPPLRRQVQRRPDRLRPEVQALRAGQAQRLEGELPSVLHDGRVQVPRGLCGNEVTYTTTLSS